MRAGIIKRRRQWKCDGRHSFSAATKATIRNAGNMQEEAVSENATEPPDNDLIDFDAF